MLKFGIWIGISPRLFRRRYLGKYQLNSVKWQMTVVL